MLRATAGSSQAQASKLVPHPDDSDDKMPTTLTLRGRIKDIEVILVENSMEPESSQALVLSFSCTADVDNVSLAHFSFVHF